MNIGLIDVDGHNFPNLALMKISAYHKARGDTVSWWWGWDHYDIVYMSKVFSAEYSPDIPEPPNADRVIKGGTGYCISTVNGKEVFDESKNNELPSEVEKCFPDYSIYPQYDFAVSFTSRGCPRGCGFCIVGKKEGRCSRKVADVKDYWNGQNVIKVLDPNLTACREKRDLFQQYRETGARIDFTQGLDIRLLNDADVADLNAMRLYGLHFAWDNPEEDLGERFDWAAKALKKTYHGTKGSVFILTNYEDCSEEEHIERALLRINAVRDNFDPYLMIYRKPSAGRRLVKLQKYVNCHALFRSCTWEEFKNK